MAEVHYFLLVFDFLQEGGFEVYKPHIENKFSPVQCDELFGCRLVGFRTGTGRNKYINRKIVANDTTDDLFERSDRDIKRLPAGLLLGRTGYGGPQR